ncbi:MAG: pyrroline-5-carboxylate reductase [Rubrivivax sp.]|nr:MAG: pyrroline-5-carboxylate reductase [Rubrivivax sp.]
MNTTTTTPPGGSSALLGDDALIAFIGGGNMATAIIQGLLRQGRRQPASILVVDPGEAQRERLSAQGLRTSAGPDAALKDAAVVVWAVKPQQFKEAAAACVPFTAGALHYSVMAGLRSDDIARLLGTPRVVRAMPNTPALVGQGMTGLFARAGVSSQGHELVERVLRPTGELLWVDDESALDAVTAMSGSGPAYVFYFIEAMTEAGIDMGLTPEQAQRLAIGTFTGASALARSADEPPAVLRARVTSKGGTTYAALQSMEAADVKTLFKAAIRAAEQRAGELAIEFGRA